MNNFWNSFLLSISKNLMEIFTITYDYILSKCFLWQISRTFLKTLNIFSKSINNNKFSLFLTRYQAFIKYMTNFFISNFKGFIKFSTVKVKVHFDTFGKKSDHQWKKFKKNILSAYIYDLMYWIYKHFYYTFTLIVKLISSNQFSHNTKYKNWDLFLK